MMTMHTRFIALLALGLTFGSPAFAGMSNPTSVNGTANKITCSPNYGKAVCTLPAVVQIDTSLAIGGATIGTNALAVTGTSVVSGMETAAGFNATGATIPSAGMYLSSTDVLAFSTASSRRWYINNGGWIANNNQGVLLSGAASSATVPTVVPNQNTTTAGLGGASGVPAMIVGGATVQSWSSSGTVIAQPLTLPGGTLLATSANLTNGAAAQSGTLTNAPTAGNPTKWIPINDNGTTRYIPAW